MFSARSDSAICAPPGPSCWLKELLARRKSLALLQISKNRSAKGADTIFCLGVL